MKFRYDKNKNAGLIKHREIGFEEIILEINRGNLVDVIDYHNNLKYPNQK
jgi:hypothetical protein